MKLLHVIATPRATESNTLKVSFVFLKGMQSRYPDLEVDTINVFNQNLPDVAGDNIESKYTLTMGQPIDKRQKESWYNYYLLRSLHIHGGRRLVKNGPACI